MVISVLNLKGGSGKTTTATNLAVGLAQTGKKTILIDSDLQGSSLKWMNERPEDAVKVTLISLPEAETLRKQIKEFRSLYDFVVIDGSPHVDKLASVSISISDLIILPVTPSPYDIWSTETMIERINNARDINSSIDAYFLINRFSQRTRLSQEVQEALENLTVPVLKSKLCQRVAYPDSALQGLSVLETSHDKAKEEVNALIQEVLTIISKE